MLAAVVVGGLMLVGPATVVTPPPVPLPATEPDGADVADDDAPVPVPVEVTVLLLDMVDCTLEEVVDGGGGWT